MTTTIRLLPISLALLAGLGGSAQPGRAEEPPPAAPQTIVEVRVRGNKEMSENAILAMLKTRVAQQYGEQVVKDDQRRLMETGRFDDVIALKVQTDKGIIVTFSVKERPLVSAVLFRGNKHFKASKLRDEIVSAPASPLSLSRIQIDRETIENLYKADGFYFVTVNVNRQALELRRQVVYDIVEGPRIRVKKIRFVFDGPRSFRSLTLNRKVKTSRSWWVLSRGKLDNLQLARDVVNLRNFYRDEGYLDAEVDSDLQFSEDKTKVEVIFLIREGPRYRIANVQFEGNTVFPDRELADRLSMTRGEYFTALELQRDTTVVRDTYGEIGHLEAVVRPRNVFVDPEAPPPPWLELKAGAKPALLNIIYTIEEGEPFRLGRVTIRGNDITEDRVIRRQLRFFPEQLFNTVAVQESRRRLLEGRLFETVTITPYGDAPSVRDTLVSVQERGTAEFTIGAGFSTNSGVTGAISFTQRNFSWTNIPESWGDFIRGRGFKGGGQTFRINLEPGTEMIRARVDWREPYLFDLPISLGTGVYIFTRGRESYDETRMGAQVSLGKLFKNRWYGEVAVRVENVRLDELDVDAPPEVVEDKGDQILLGLGGTLVRDRTDNRWEPSKGDRLRFSTEQVTGDHDFTKAGAEYTRYYTLYMDALDRKHILASRARFDGILTGEAPVFERFYGGGLGSVRGFDFRGISPRSKGTDESIGGDLRLYIGGEYSFPIVGKDLRGVIFLDTGTVEEDYTITTWRSSAGFGIRLLIPFFGPVPMSLDFGFPISKDDQDDTQMLNFTFGWVY